MTAVHIVAIGGFGFIAVVGVLFWLAHRKGDK